MKFVTPLLLVAAAHAAELSGYAEARASYLIGVHGTAWGLVERVRPRFKAWPTDRLAVEAVVQAQLVQGRFPDQVFLDAVGGDAADALGAAVGGFLSDDQIAAFTDALLAPPPRYDEVSDWLSVERLHADLQLERVDLTIGRQALNWGSSLFFQPTSFFAELLVTEPWRERQGFNAVRADVPLGEHSVTAAAAVGDDLSVFYGDEAPAFEDLPLSSTLRGTLRALGTDFTAVAQGAADGRWFTGADMKGTLGVGWWVEGGWHGQGDASEPGAPEAVVGLDWSFPWLQVLYLAAEYRYDGRGADPADYFGEDYLARLLPDAEPPDSPTLGRHYAHSMLRWGLTEEVSVSHALLVNLEDGSGASIPGAGVLVGGRGQINLGAQVPFGQGEFNPDPADLAGPMGDALGASLSDGLAASGLDLEVPVEVTPETVDGLLPSASLFVWGRFSF